MKYISIDVETTGLNPETCQILSFGAIIEDTNNLLSFEEIPKFYKVFKHNFIQGEPFALNMNADLIKEIKEGTSKSLIAPRDFLDSFTEFLSYNLLWDYDNDLYPKLKVAGKNFNGFDKLFIEKIPGLKGFVEFHQRVLDPASLFTDFKNDEWLPNLSVCKEKANLDVIEVSHNALEDAWDVIKVLRTKY